MGAEIVNHFTDLTEKLHNLEDVVGDQLLFEIFPLGEEWGSPFHNIALSIEEDDYDAQQLLDTLRVGITQPELPTDVDYVRIMSLHKSKGLTANMVIVVGCIEGLIPFIRQDATDEERSRDLEEQRRLFYVAITRPRQTLVLSSITQLPRDLAHRMGARVGSGGRTSANTIASRFLSELGSERPEAVLGEILLG